MFYFRINKLKIIDNKELPRYLGLFGPDKANVRLISFVTTDVMNLPDMTELIATNDRKKKDAILIDAISQVVNSRVLTTIQNVKDNHVMFFGDTGYVLYQSNQIPKHFDWQFIAYESNREIRETSKMIDDIISDKEFDNFSDNFISLVGKATNPAYYAAVSIGKFAAKVALKIAKQNKDEMIGIIYMSLNRWEHYPYGERKRDDVPDMTNNMMVDYSIFAYDDKAIARFH